MMSLKNMLGKLAKKVIEEAPNLIAKAAANAAAEAKEQIATYGTQPFVTSWDMGDWTLQLKCR